jgi:predicted Ser/Thr protein kinase
MIVIQKEAWMHGTRLSHGATWMQANVYLTDCDNQKIVIKDFSEAPWLIRHTFCRFVLNREIRAMQRLQPLRITPRYFGLVGDYAYAMEYIEGENFQFKKHVKDVEFLIAMKKSISAMHNLGVTHNDLHSKNIIVSSDGVAYFIDFSSAIFRSDSMHWLGKIKNTLFTFLTFVDDAKITHLIEKYDPSLLTISDKRSLSIKKYTSFFMRLWKKLINRPLLHKRTWQKRREHFRRWLNR